MSWTRAVKKTLEKFEASVEETQRGNLLVKPVKQPNFTSMIIVRRMQFSLDMKFEIIGVLDIPEDRVRDRERSQLLKKMLSESVELEVKGVLVKRVEVRRWSELSALKSKIPLPEGGGLFSMLKNDKNVEKDIKKSRLELLEIFPRLIPAELLEYYMLASGRGLVIGRLVKEYLESPQSVSWILRAHLMYGMPFSGGGTGRSYLTVLGLAKKVEDFTYTSLLP
ncbi:MAG: hypothetical protein QXN75_01725 [Thermoproteota archaeon]|nr:hypothetical protein [Candidatus Brockarchaeota archaeon]